MSIKLQIFALLSCFLLSFIYIRSFLYGVKRFQLNNSSFKKRKKKESFIEWLLYSRYREEIPKVLLGLYFFVLFIHSLGVFVCLCLYFIKLHLLIGAVITKIVIYFDASWIIIALLFWSPGRDYAYGRWISKKGNPPQKEIRAIDYSFD